ncbi:MAG: hypothetical protein Q7T21_13900, partial [Gallionella sp.]|nr:hypothetical protein [Gallionella sp.]
MQNQKARHSGLAASQFILSLPKGLNDSCYICLCHESRKRRFIHSIRHCERSVAIQLFDIKRTSGLPRRYAPRNDDLICVSLSK